VNVQLIPMFSRLCPPPSLTGSSRAATKSRRSCRNQPWLVSGWVGVRRGGGRGFVLVEEKEQSASVEAESMRV